MLNEMKMRELYKIYFEFLWIKTTF